MALHGHGEIRDVLIAEESAHRAFGLRLAQAGHLVLCPVLRGFDALADVALHLEGYTLDYWSSPPQKLTLVTDGFLHGKPLIGVHVEDVLCWEDWFTETHGLEHVAVAGFSYGGDLAFTYPPFSARVGRSFASGTLGSFAVIYARCYNAPAPCIPNILNWMDRSDIAGLNAPRPITFHYGAFRYAGPRELVRIIQ